jgi:hypothetical protein
MDDRAVSSYPDGLGGFYAVFDRVPVGVTISTATATDIIAVHVGSDGTLDPGWPADGLPVCTAPRRQVIPRLAGDGGHGCFVVWNDNRSTSAAAAYMTHLVPTGLDPAWPTDGIPVTGTAAVFPSICNDGAGGAFVAWTDSRAGAANQDIYAQHVAHDGTFLWGPNGVPATTASSRQQINGTPTTGVWITQSTDLQGNEMVPDGQGGFFVAWTDNRVGTEGLGQVSTVYAQHIRADGSVAPGWPADGVRLADPAGFSQNNTDCEAQGGSWNGTACQFPGSQSWARLLSDGNGGCFATWMDEGKQVRAQHVLSSGTLDGTPAGLLVTLPPIGNAGAAMVSDGSAGIYLAPGQGGIQHVLPNPLHVDPAWPAGGVAEFAWVEPSGLLSDAHGGVLALDDFYQCLDVACATASPNDLYHGHILPTGQLATATPTEFVHVSPTTHGQVQPSGTVTLCDVSGTFVFTPDIGYRVLDVTVDGSSMGAVDQYTFAAGAGDHTLAVEFTLKTYSIGASASAGGSISPSGTTTIAYGGSQVYSITPDAGNHIVDVLVDGASVGAVATFEFPPVSADHTISATFALDQYAITAIAGPGGSIVPSGVTLVSHGGSQAYTITPDNGRLVDDVLVDGVSVGNGPAYTFTNVTGPHSIVASFKRKSHNIAISTGAVGTVYATSTESVLDGDDYTVTLAPPTGYEVADVLVDGTSVGALTSYTFTDVTEDHALVASFTPIVYTVTATAGAGGHISPSGTISVAYGTDKTITITADADHNIVDVQVDGASVGAVTSYTFSAVTANHFLSVSFNSAQTTITASAQAGGGITPSGAVVVNTGGSQGFTVTPSSCFVISALIVDGATLPPADNYTFNNVTSPHTIEARFAPNPPPSAQITSPSSGYVVPVGVPVVFGGTFTDNAGDTHTATWTFDTSAPIPGVVDETHHTVTLSRTFTDAGVYLVRLEVRDACGAATTDQVDGLQAMVVAYDPDAGFVTGGGWFNSPAGALPSLPLDAERANFGFVAKYATRGVVPTGESKFKLKSAGFEFESTSLDWLVISGATAQFRGTGKVNSQGDYLFTVSVADGEQNGGPGTDKMRMKISNKATSQVVYDNQPGSPDFSAPVTPIGGGMIAIHNASTGASAIGALPGAGESAGPVPADFALASGSPNPFRTETELAFDLPVACDVSMRVYDVTGREVRSLAAGGFSAGRHSARWSARCENGASTAPGLYIVRMTASGQGRRFTAVRRIVVL